MSGSARMRANIFSQLRTFPISPLSPSCSKDIHELRSILSVNLKDIDPIHGV